MAFTKYSKTGSNLTFDRENNIFANIIEDGVYSGMQVYNGSSGFDISIAGGYFSKNGIIWRDNAVSTDIITVPTPVTNEHHIIWVDVSTDNPTYEIKSGTFASPAELDPSELLNGLVIAHIWVNSAATNITQCNIANMDKVSSLDKRKLFCTAEILRVSEPSSQTIRVRTLNARLLMIGADSYGRNFGTFPIQNVNNVDITGVTQRYFILFVRSLNDYQNESETLSLRFLQAEDVRSATESLVQIQGTGAGYVASTNKDHWPHRPNIGDVHVLAIYDRTRNMAIYPDFGVSPAGGGVSGSQLESMISEISSTAYGTSEIGPTVDIDDLITNIGTISQAGLDDVYRGMGTGITYGTRVIRVSEPVEFGYLQQPQTDLGDNSWAAITRYNFDQDSLDEVRNIVKGIDFVSIYTNADEKAIQYRRPASINGKNCITQITSLIDGTSRVEINTLNSIDTADFVFEFGAGYATHRTGLFTVELTDCDPYSGGFNYGAIFGLGADFVANVFYLIDLESNLPVLPATLSGLSYPASVNVTLWDTQNQLSFNKNKLRNIEVSGEITAAGSKILENKIISSGLLRSQISDSSKKENKFAPVRIGRKGYVQEIYNNGGSWAGSRRIFTDGAHMVTSLVVNAAPITVQIRNCDTGAVLGTFSTDSSATSVSTGYMSCFSTSYGVIVCVPCGLKVEFWLYSYDTGLCSKIYDYNYADGATFECRSSLMISDSAAWIGGDYNTVGGQHNAALYELGTGIIQRYRFGKNNNCELYARCFDTDGYHLVASTINGVSAAASSVECGPMAEDGQYGGAYMINGAWTGDITAPQSACITDDHVIVYGTGAGNAGFIEKYPIYQGLIGSSTDTPPIDSLELDIGVDLTLSGDVYGRKGEFVFIAEDNNIGAATETTCFILVIRESDFGTKLSKEFSRSVNNFKPGAYAFDGIDVFWLNQVDNKCYKMTTTATGKCIESAGAGFITRRATRLME